MNRPMRATPFGPVEGRRIELRGIVQGVGLRPHLLRLARKHGLTGSVHNEGTAAVVHAFGTATALLIFGVSLREKGRGGLRIDSIKSSPIDVPAEMPSSFEISSSATALPGLGIAPDWATCPACVAETLDPLSRRYRYPFIACTDCGPRLSVFQHAPYDRARTTMAPFPLCAACEREYANPEDRRFHSQAMACHACGPRATLRRLDGHAFSLDALTALDDTDAASTLVGKGEVVLIKGLGGYQLA